MESPVPPVPGHTAGGGPQTHTFRLSSALTPRRPRSASAQCTPAGDLPSRPASSGGFWKLGPGAWASQHACAQPPRMSTCGAEQSCCGPGLQSHPRSGACRSLTWSIQLQSFISRLHYKSYSSPSSSHYATDGVRGSSKDLGSPFGSRSQPVLGALLSPCPWDFTWRSGWRLWGSLPHSWTVLMGGSPSRLSSPPTAS